MVITPEEYPKRCASHGFGQYQDSLTCPMCRASAKCFLMWAAFQVPESYTAVAFTGSSGAAFGYWFADEFGLIPIQVFKDGEQRHGTNRKLDRFESAYSKKGWVFLDDFIAMGGTFTRVKEAMGSMPAAAITYMPTCMSVAAREVAVKTRLISRRDSEQPQYENSQLKTTIEAALSWTSAKP